MAEPVGEIPVIISGDTTELQKTLTGLVGLVGTAMAGLGTAALNAGLLFDEAFDGIRIATGATGPQLQSLTDSFSAVFTSIPVSAGEASDAIATLNQRLGLTGEPLETLATQMLNLARITGTEVGPLIASSTRLFGDWSIATDKQSGTMDALFRTTQTTGIEIKKMMDLVVQFGAPMRALGFSLEETATLMGKWEKEGVNITTLLSGLKIGLSNMAAAGKDPKEMLAGLMVSLKGASTDIEAVGLAAEIFGKRAGTDLAMAVREGRFEIGDLLKTIGDGKDTINTAASDTDDFGEKWVLFKNKLNAALEPLGTKLMDILGKLMDKTQPILDFVSGMVKWFGDLPEPVQNAAVAIGAIVAVVGTAITAFGAVSLAMPAITAGLGMAGAAFAAIVSPVGLAVAALAALGVWVAANWEPIVAVVTQAWDGLTELWDAVWGPVSTVLTTAWTVISEAAKLLWGGLSGFIAAIWAPVGAAFSAAWTPISALLNGIWDGIKLAAQTVWNVIVAAIQGFLDIAAKIPGVKKLMNLDDAWESAKKAGEEITKVKTATVDLGDEAKLAAPKVVKLTTSVDDVKKASVKAKEESKLLEKAFRDLGIEAGGTGGVKSKIDKLEDSVKEIERAWQNGKVPIADYQRALNALQGEVDKSKLADLKQKVKDLDTEFKNGIWSTGEYKTKHYDLTEQIKKLVPALAAVPSPAAMAEEALKNLNDVVFASTGKISDNITNQVLLQSTLDGLKVDAPVAALGGLKTALGDVATTASTELPKVKGYFDTLSEDVGGVFAHFGGESLKALFGGEGSLGDRFKKLATGMKDALIDVFLAPVEEAIKDFIAGTIADLLGGKGFGGVLDSIKNIGTSLAGVFGGGDPGGIPGVGGAPGIDLGGIGGAASGAAGAAGSAGSTAAGAAGQVASTGAMAIAGLVTGIASAVSGIIGNFQNMAMNKSLDLIVMHTLQIANDLSNLRRDEWDRETHMMERTGGMWTTLVNIYDFLGANLPGILEATRNLYNLEWDNINGSQQLAMAGGLSTPVFGNPSSDSSFSGQRASVIVNAVDPSARGVTKALVEGLNELGIKVR